MVKYGYFQKMEADIKGGARAQPLHLWTRLSHKTHPTRGWSVAEVLEQLPNKLKVLRGLKTPVPPKGKKYHTQDITIASIF
jgi:hypothetical protein